MDVWYVPLQPELDLWSNQRVGTIFCDWTSTRGVNTNLEGWQTPRKVNPSTPPRQFEHCMTVYVSESTVKKSNTCGVSTNRLYNFTLQSCCLFTFVVETLRHQVGDNARWSLGYLCEHLRTIPVQLGSRIHKPPWNGSMVKCYICPRFPLSLCFQILQFRMFPDSQYHYVLIFRCISSQHRSPCSKIPHQIALYVTSPTGF